jgi:hypothetical protein
MTTQGEGALFGAIGLPKLSLAQGLPKLLYPGVAGCWHYPFP